MKNICSLVIICVLTPWLAFGASAGSNHIRLLGSDLNTSVIRLETGDFSYSSVQTGWGQAKLISTEGAVKLIKEGAPELPAFSASLVIPDLARMELEIIGATYTEYTDIEIAPSKGFLLRNQDPSSVPYAKGEEYNQNSFYPGKLADLHKPYILRDFRGQTLSFYPFQYNPQTKVLRVYKELTVKIYKADDNGLNPFYRERPFEHVQAEFNKIYSRHFLNYSASVSRYTPVEEQGNMLVISHGPFMSDMAPFVYWKKQKGINVEMVDVSTIGNATAIENYISNYYTNNGLAFVLLVGDAQYVPCSMTGAGDSDNKYGYISGNDSYPEVLVGRFSCETNAEVQTMVDRVLRYEKTPPTSGSWYTTGLGIASDQGPGDDNEMDFEHIRNIRTDLLGFTYSTVHEMYDGSQGGADATGSPTPSMVGNAVNSGLSIINYCGHGSSYSFGTSGFSGNDVDQLTNVDMCPFIFSVACVNGQFVGQTCFAEKWLRATDNNTGEPTGAIGTMMSTINQSWDPPMDAQDEMNDILTEMYSNNIKRTFAGIGINGCLQMNDDYGQQGDDMTDTWTVFGDPSVMVRTAVPGSMTVTHVTSVNTGETSTLVNCNTDDAVICLLQDSMILGTGIVSGGNVTITFPAITSLSDILVTATAFNKMPYSGTIMVNPVGIDAYSEGMELQVSPSPANDHIDVLFTLDAPGAAKVAILNALGQETVLLNDNELDEGPHILKLPCGNLAEGMYFVRLSAGSFSTTKKILLVH